MRFGKEFDKSRVLAEKPEPTVVPLIEVSKRPHGSVRAREIVDAAISRLNEINERLETIADELNKLQAWAPGKVSLYLYHCGRSCSACPHVRWRQWRLVRRKMCAFDIQHPLKNLHSSKPFRQHASESKSLVVEAQNIEAERRSLTKYISNLARALKAQRNKSTNLYHGENS